LWAIATAFAQESPVILVTRAVVRAIRQEAGWLRRRHRRRTA
jgi:hypothetical protein